MKNLPVYLKYLFNVWIFSILMMTAFRIVLYFTIKSNWQLEEEFITKEIFQSFWMGFRYDNVITSYLLFLPFILLTFNFFIKLKSRVVLRIITIYYYLVFGICLFILCADIPFYVHFNSRLTTASLLWAGDFGYMTNMILKDWAFLSYLVLFFVVYGVLIYILRKIAKKYNSKIESWNSKKQNIRTSYSILSISLVILLLIISARGRLNPKATIKIGTAYFSNNQTLNKIALNPIYTFGHSFANDLKTNNKVNLMDEKKGLELSSRFKTIPQSDSNVLNIFTQWKVQNTEDSAKKKNVVVILMESMGTFKMGHFNGEQNLTPNLNELTSKSIYFNNFYTSGIHTFNGIYSTLFSFPALYKLQPLEELMNVNHDGIAEILNQNGYSTSYFTTHDPNFDNVYGFLKANSFNDIYSDYPTEWIETTNGIPDHRMFEYAIPVLNKKAKESPFFSVFMTASDHRPFVIPKETDFIPQTDKIETQITEYADWSIGRFMDEASKQDWYSNTVFVLLADHGQNLGHTYDMPLSNHHSPLILFSPSHESIADTLECLAGQIDVAPTILSLLGIDYENKTLGLDLFTHSRPYMFFCADDKIGCLDKEHYLILREENWETLYKYENLETINYFDSLKSKVDSMKNYTFSIMQTADYLLKK